MDTSEKANDIHLSGDSNRMEKCYNEQRVKTDHKTADPRHDTNATREGGQFRGRGRPFHKRGSSSRGSTNARQTLYSRDSKDLSFQQPNRTKKKDPPDRNEHSILNTKGGCRPKSSYYRGKDRKSWPRSRTENWRQITPPVFGQVYRNDLRNGSPTSNDHEPSDVDLQKASEFPECDDSARYLQRRESVSKRQDSERKMPHTKHTATKKTFKAASSRIPSRQQSQERHGDARNKETSVTERKDRIPQIGFPLLRSLLDQDPSMVVLTLARNSDALIECIQRAERENDLLEVLIEVVSRAFTSQTTASSLIKLFDVLQKGRFFEIISGFLVRLQDHIENGSEKHLRKTKYIVNHLLTIMWAQITRNPSSLAAFLLLHRTMSMNINSLIEQNHLDEDIATSFCQFTQHKKELQMSKRSQKSSDDNNSPPDNFRDMPTLPTAAEIKGEIQPFLRKNKTEGEYDDLEHYLDVQYRLLREDFVGPLRGGIMEYIRQVTTGERERNSDIRLYENVWIYTPIVTEHGLCYKVQFEMTRRLRQVNWAAGKRLKFGSLVCLSDDDFETLLIAIVINNDNAKHGKITLQLVNENMKSAELMMKTFKMAETTGYFEAYKHVLKSLQTFDVGSLPFEDYIVFSETISRPPVYIKEDTKYDLRPVADSKCIIRETTEVPPAHRTNLRVPASVPVQPKQEFDVKYDSARSVTVLDSSTWPTKDVLELDESQMNAVRDALTREFAVIQGPPGTGKTYIGLKIVKALLSNRSNWAFEDRPAVKQARLSLPPKPARPILVVCYTNHALDQFLEGIVSFYEGITVRVGGNCSSEILQEHSLKKYRRGSLAGIRIKQIKEDAKNELNNLSRDMDKCLVQMEIFLRDVLHEKFLKSVMDIRHSEGFTVMSDKVTGHVVLHWLRVPEIEAAVIQDCQGLVNANENEFLNVDVETGDRSREERILDELLDGKALRLRHTDAFEDLRKNVSAYYVNKTKLKNLCDKVRIINSDLNEIQGNINRLENLECNRIKKFGQGLTFHEWQELLSFQHELRNKVAECRIVEERLSFEREFVSKMKRQLRFLLSANPMTQSDANEIDNIWTLNINDRWRLYSFWIRSLCEGLYEDIDRKRQVFQIAAERVKEAQAQEDTEILKKASVIGMTTTGAAKHLEILKNVRPRIVVVEEAAEVLEAHIITTLTKDCDHLILIGDHKQLRPNPAVYRLAVKFNLNISLFERMLNNGVQYNSLKLQHRMRPEIADIMRHIYPNLEDHEYVKTYPLVKGISTNLMFINHSNEEIGSGDSKSYSNPHEAEFVAELCRYLLKQGYSREQITVLTTYTGQLFEIKKHMPKYEFDGMKITVVDNYQGEENDIVILSLVRSNRENRIGFLKIENRICVALSRAKIGFYVLGNITHLSAHSSLWLRLRNDLEKQKRLSDGLTLRCQNHPNDTPIVAKTPKDFNAAPEGGCQKICDARLTCGHKCEKHCHPTDLNHKLYKCQKECHKTCKEMNHKCKSKCFEICPPCDVELRKTIPQCGHSQLVPCHMDPNSFSCQVLPCTVTLPCGHACRNKCGEEHTTKCKEKVVYKWENCGHTKKISCWQKGTLQCTAPCKTILKCEHECTGTCHSCKNGRFHDQCRVKCGRILICGHQCTDTCDSCPPCSLPCENRCVHSRCQKKCGELCQPCMEKCTWECAHYKCTKLCSEPCNRPACQEPCSKKLKCGHICIGLCGDICPILCRKCDEEKVTEIFFGTEDEPDARFVQLDDCRHIIEVTSLDEYMLMGKGDETNIQLKTCPKCKTPIRKNRRYGKYINAVLLDIEQVKQTTIGDQNKIIEITKEIHKTLGLSHRHTDTRLKRLNLSFHTPKIKENEIDALKTRFKVLETELLSLQLIQTIQIQIRFTSIFEKLSGTIEKDRRVRTYNIDFLHEIISDFKKDRRHISSQETDDANREVFRYESIAHLLKLIKRLQEVGKEKIASKDIEKAEATLAKNCVVSDAMKVEIDNVLGAVKSHLKVEGLGIEEDERMSIVKAMDPSKKGHWFKCPNKHIYYIGECGGANQRSKCPECKSDIGGEHHRLAEGNALAAEMDNAPFAAYSEEANNMGNFNLEDLH